MSEYIIACDEETALWVANDVESMKRIVRCRECEFGAYDGNEQGEVIAWCKNFGCEIEPDGFCKWGERLSE